VKYTYLLINFFTVLFPVVLSFDKRVQFYKSWKFIWPGMLITGIVFLFWDVLFTLNGVWSFNDDRIIGIKFFQLPLEEVLFFLTVPFACLFIYACLNYYIKWQPSDKWTRIITNLLIVLSAAFIVLCFDRLYTMVTFGLLLPLLFIIQYVFKVKWLGRLYLMYVVALIPFYIVNGLLTYMPVVLYNNIENMAIRIGTIPVEDHFYCMAMLLMNVSFFEYFKARENKMSELPVYTKSQLALRNGQDKPEVWIAYKGLIYDVSRSRLWRNGKHYEHWAGQDLTKELGDAPHDEWVFQNFDAIGKLA